MQLGFRRFGLRGGNNLTGATLGFDLARAEALKA